MAVRQKINPADSRMVSPEEQYAILSAGRTLKDYLAGWNVRLGKAAHENKRIVDDLIDEKLTTVLRGLRGGGTAVDIEVHTEILVRNKRLADLLNKDALSSYISLSIFHALEDFRKTNKLKFLYIVRK
jgi:hypothetical protein